MRPKYVILCVDDNERDLSVLKFTLQTNGYRVLTATESRKALALLVGCGVNAVLVADTVYDGGQVTGKQLVVALKEVKRYVPMILLGDPAAAGAELHMADLMLSKHTYSSQQLLEHIKTMATRKRGPRKGWKRQLQEVTA